MFWRVMARCGVVKWYHVGLMIQSSGFKSRPRLPHASHPRISSPRSVIRWRRRTRIASIAPAPIASTSSHDLRRVALLAALIIPGPHLQFALNVDPASLFQVLAGYFREFAPQHYAVPFRPVLASPVLRSFHVAEVAKLRLATGTPLGV